MGERVLPLFEDFMKRVLDFESMEKLGSQILASFLQDLEVLRRPPLQDTSVLVKEILARNQSPREIKYMEAGCRHWYNDKIVLANLDTQFKKLGTYIIQVEQKIGELRTLLETANSLMHEELTLKLEKANIFGQIKIPDADENNIVELPGERKSRPLRQAHDYVTMMAVLLSMLEKEYEMQERIVSSLRLDTPAEILQNYCLLLTLRPYIDEQVFETCLTWV